MNVKAEAPNSKIVDIVKQVASVVLVVAGISAFYYFASTPLLYRVLGLLVLLVAVLALLYSTESGHQVWAFCQEAKIEVRKIVWPTRDETMRTTLMVFVMVFVVGLGLWFLDMFLFWGIRLITGQGA